MPCQSPLHQITVAATQPSSAFLSTTMSQQSQHPQLNSMAPNGGNGSNNSGTSSSQQQQQQASQQPTKKVIQPRNQNGYNVKAMAAIKNDLSSFAKQQPDHQAYQRPASVLSTGSSSSGFINDSIQTLMQNFSIDEVSLNNL